MTASVALHEIEKLVPRMEETVRQNLLDKDIIKEQVAELKLYTEGIISVLHRAGRVRFRYGPIHDRRFPKESVDSIRKCFIQI